MFESVAALAAAAGAALVGAAATYAWTAAKDGLLALFGRGGERRHEVAAARLDADAAKVESATEAERDQVRAELLPAWQTRVADLLEEFPEAREDLEAWAQRIRSQLPAAEQSWVQSNTARDHGMVFAVQGGRQYISQAPPASGGAGGGDGSDNGN